MNARSRRWRLGWLWKPTAASLLLGLTCWLGWCALVRAAGYPVERVSVRDASSLLVVDRHGRQLWQGGTEAGEKRSWSPLAEIAPSAVNAALASEDHRFYQHSGVDVVGVLRALYLNVRTLGARYGASTISMQLVRLLEPELDTRSVLGKLAQALHATRLERAVDKRTILEQYLNRAYYGNGAFGLASAARLYFGTSPGHLSPGQAAFLAALPRAPRGYDPYLHRPRAEARMRHILSRMHELGALSAVEYRLALDTPLTLRRERPAVEARHFIDHLLVTLPREQLHGTRIQSTLDLALQEQLEVATRRHLENMGSRALTQAGVIVIDNHTGDILAMVGSGDYADAEAHGAVNVTTLPRRAGSTLKPFVYALALERGDSPATLAYDVVLPGEANETYTADVRQHGFARYRESLAGSYNLAAVHTLERVGVQSLVDRLRRAGITTLSEKADAYGPDLAIGNAEIRLIEYTGAFAAFGNRGRAVHPHAVLRVDAPLASSLSAVDPRGARGASELVPGPAISTPVFSPEVAYQIFDILSDPDARRPMFGRTAPLELGFPVALKTGTTRGYTDTLAFGTTREFTVGVWAGNFDGTPTEGVMAMQGAAPLVRAAFVSLAALYGTPTAPERPASLVFRDVCPVSGQRPGPHCPSRKRDIFTEASARAFDRAPACSFHTPAAADQRHVNGGAGLAFPPELGPWAAAHRLGDTNRHAPTPAGALSIAYPPSGAFFQLDSHRPARAQVPPLQAIPAAGVDFTIDGGPAEDFEPSPGRHRLRAQRGHEYAEAEFFYE